MGVPLKRGRQIGVPPPKRRYFVAVDSFSVKTVADRYMLLITTSTNERLYKFINIDDLERP